MSLSLSDADFLQQAEEGLLQSARNYVKTGRYTRLEAFALYFASILLKDAGEKGTDARILLNQMADDLLQGNETPARGVPT